MLIKAKALIPKVAKQLHIPEELVEDVINFYFKSVRKKIEKLSTDRIRVTGLGVIHVRPEKLKESIDKLNNALNSENGKSFKRIVKRKKLEEALEEQQLFMSKLIENGSISNLEKQKSNPRRDKE